jgi:hypothetical protein
MLEEPVESEGTRTLSPAPPSAYTLSLSFSVSFVPDSLSSFTGEPDSLQVSLVNTSETLH